MKSIALFFSILVFISCSNSNSALEQELTDVKAELANVSKQLERVSNDLHDSEQEFPLVHVVYFKLKPEADKAKLIEEINRLRRIAVINKLEIGKFEDLEDERALSDYQLMISMQFKSIEDYKIYQQHDIHLGLKKAFSTYLAGYPVTYDYIKL